jgi:outer membrane protein TolC
MFLIAVIVSLAVPVLFGAPGAALAQGFTVPANPDSALNVALAAIEGVPLTLDEAIQAALTGGSTAAQVASAALASARGAHRREVGLFDPELFFTGSKFKEDQPTASPFAGASVLETETTTGVGGARITLPFGTDISASLDGSRVETNSDFAALDPQYDASGRIAVRQPLLKGFGPGTGSEAKATKREAEAALARYDDVMLGVQALVEQVYWDLYAAERDLAVSRLIRDQASALATQAELRARSGLVGPNDVANARVFLAEQEQTVLDREEDLDTISDRLASLIGRRPPGGAPRYRPTDNPPSQFPIEPEDSVVVRALRDNRSIRAFEQDLAAARARVQGAGWNRLPQLDFIGSIGGRGLSGTGQDVIFGSDTLSTAISGGFSDAWSQVSGRDFPTWSAGVALSIPLFLREGRGEYDRLRGEEEQAAQRLEEARRALEVEVRTAHRALVRASKRFQAAQDGADASRDQVRIGVLQYNSGRTTAFELVRLGADLASAQQRYSQALVRTAKAESALRFLTSSGYATATIQRGGTKP